MLSIGSIAEGSAALAFRLLERQLSPSSMNPLHPTLLKARGGRFFSNLLVLLRQKQRRPRPDLRSVRFRWMRFWCRRKARRPMACGRMNISKCRK